MKAQGRVQNLLDTIESNRDLELMCPEICLTLRWVLSTDASQ
jgi:hypothetical protein